MKQAQQKRGLVARAHAATALVLLTLVALALTAASASAYQAYQHGGIDDCETCHMNAHTLWTPTDEICVTCHRGYQTVRSNNLCWTCHAPGEDMSWARTGASCLSTCHLGGGVEFAHTGHTGGSGACTDCHAVSVSPEYPAGSPHHVVPAPRIDAITPLSAAPGAAVTVSGRDLSWTAIVRFGGVDADFSVVSNTGIIAIVPAAAESGPISVLSPGGAAMGDADFVVIRAAPPQSPSLTLAARPRTVRAARRVRLAGALTPVRPGARVRIVVQRRVAGVWRRVAASGASSGAGGVFAWSYKARRMGRYRVRATVTGAVSPWARFRSLQPVRGARVAPLAAYVHQAYSLP